METIKTLENTVEELKEEIVQLRYQPGGPGYLESKESFEEEQKKQFKDVGSLD